MKQKGSKSMNSIKDCRIIKFTNHGDQRGSLVAIESKKEIPFNLKRIFYIFESNNRMIRGQHANMISEFVLVCVSGNCTVKVSDSKEEKLIELSSPFEGLYIPNMIWKEMSNFSSDSILLVLSSAFYNKDEYITDFEKYKSIMENTTHR